MTMISRRGFLAATAAMAALTTLPARGQTASIGLAARSRVLDIDGRAAKVWGLEGPSGQGVFLDPGARFRVDLTNALPEPTLIHWHGQIPPNIQDGVPDMPMSMLAPGAQRSYDFAPAPGTYWMHAHVPLHEMRLLAAPLIVRAPGDDARQEVVMMLHDFSFTEPEEVMERITGGHGAGNGMGHGGGHGMMDHAGMHDMTQGSQMQGTMPHAAPMTGLPHADMQMDLNDYDWDAYLTNDRTLGDPEIVRVERDGKVRLRIINGAAATVFWIDTGALVARLIAVDGHAVLPLEGHRFGIAMGQRLDLELDLPGSGTWPVLALREGARERTGLVLATPSAPIAKIASMADAAAPAFDTDLAQESRLVARDPLPERPAARTQMLMLGGTMTPYLWTIDGATWGAHRPVSAISGERVELTFHNMSMMAHPMHLHGHVFQVVALNGRRIAGARRDTVHVPPMAAVTVALDAGEAARWMLHCHHMPHLQTGMMTEFAVSAA